MEEPTAHKGNIRPWCAISPVPQCAVLWCILYYSDAIGQSNVNEIQSSW